ncbi:hypothetical protein PTKIN_Ptkin09bG0119700 [Pterospermum kingtungense]
MKCNVDGPIFKALGQVGSGCVIPDAEGVFIAAEACTVHSSSLIPALAEALSFRKALSWIQASHFHDIKLNLCIGGLLEHLLC